MGAYFPKTAPLCLIVICSAILPAVAASNETIRADAAPRWDEIVEALETDQENAIDSLVTSLKPSLNEQTGRSLFERLEVVWLEGQSETWTRNLIAFSKALAVDHTAANALIVRLLEDHRPRVRQAALETAIQIEAVENQRILPLIASLHFGSGEDRFQSARLLGRFGKQAEPAAGALMRAALDDSAHASIRWEAVYALRDIGPGGVNGLANVVASADKSVAYKALDALAFLESEAEPAFDTVAEALTRDDPHIRWRAATVLSRIPARSPDSLPLLRRAAADPDQHVRDAVSAAIERLTREPSRGRPRP